MLPRFCCLHAHSITMYRLCCFADKSRSFAASWGSRRGCGARASTCSSRSSATRCVGSCHVRASYVPRQGALAHAMSARRMFRDKVRWQLPCARVVCFARAGGSSGRALSRRCVARLTAAKLAAACLCLLHHPLSVGLLGAGEQRGALGTLHGGTVSQVHLVMTMSCLSEAWAECPVARTIIIWPSSICHRVRRARKKGPREVPTVGERTGPTASCYPGTLEYYSRCMYV